MKLPEGWTRELLDRVADVRTGLAVGKTDLNDPMDVPYLRVANVQDGHLNLKEMKTITIERSQLERFSLQVGDVLMTEGGDFDKLGRGDVWKGEIAPCLHQNHVFAVRPDQSKLNPYYLSALSGSKYGKNYFLSCAKKSTNLASINSTQLKQFPVLIPPLSEQKKIAKILSTWDAAIAASAKLLENSQQQKRALMQQLLTGKKRLPGCTGEWQDVRLGDVAEMSSGGTPPSGVPSYYGGNIPWVSIADMTKNGKYISSTARFLTDSGLQNSSAQLFPTGTVLFAMYASIGECSIALNDLCSSQAILGIRPSKSVNFEYLYFFLSSLKEKIKLQGQQGTQSNLNAKMVKDFTLPLPGLGEQQRIAAILTSADQEIAALQQQLDHLKQEKQALMQQLLTGKRRVKNEGVFL